MISHHFSFVGARESSNLQKVPSCVCLMLFETRAFQTKSMIVDSLKTAHNISKVFVAVSVRVMLSDGLNEYLWRRRSMVGFNFGRNCAHKHISDPASLPLNLVIFDGKVWMEFPGIIICSVIIP